MSSDEISFLARLSVLVLPKIFNISLDIKTKTTAKQNTLGFTLVQASQKIVRN